MGEYVSHVWHALTAEPPLLLFVIIALAATVVFRRRIVRAPVWAVGVLFTAISVADLGLTQYGLMASGGAIRESNPIAAALFARFGLFWGGIALKLAGLLFFVLAWKFFAVMRRCISGELSALLNATQLLWVTTFLTMHAAAALYNLLLISRI